MTCSTVVGLDVGDDDFPLDETRIAALRQNRPSLADLLDWSNGLLAAQLLSCRCISNHQKSALESEKTCERASLLIDMLLRRSVGDFKNFMKWLEESGQQHVVDVVNGDGGALLLFFKGQFACRC